MQQKLYNRSQLLTIVSNLSILDVLGILDAFGEQIYYTVQYKKDIKDMIFMANVLSYLFTTLEFRLIIPARLTIMLSVRSPYGQKTRQI